MAQNAIPVIDFSSFKSTDQIKNPDAVRKLATELCEALSTVGFAYIANSGITENEIAQAQKVSEEFFSLPADTKRPFARIDGDANHGWVALERESVNPERPGDLKECFNVTPLHAKMWPDDCVTGFKQHTMAFFNRCCDLAHRVLYVMAVGLDVSDFSYFRKCHNILAVPNATTMRYLYYPALKDVSIKPNQVRCGEHSDYGSITLLFQDEVGGLEVKMRSGEYVPATPIPNTVLLNVADLMQRWTGDRLVSTRHRVMLPDSSESWTKVRQSIAFFVHPDDSCLIECIDGSNKYPPVNALDYLKSRFAVTY